ncbi:hypothetical protein [Brucella pseudogrignonensis]|uniref:Uncharacterized protein n=1 Tax=Brucella pseudogrignonensis TaxID=419475 RepID=A0ABU1MF13_9HYPH|nr:hypothetical protein [Brucella pseudogrignonensis]MDR6434640.1 hypothetical protein [Brucella pseudogrignonensis]
MSITTYIAAVFVLVGSIAASGAAMSARTAYEHAESFKAQSYDALDCATNFVPGTLPDLSKCVINGVRADAL